jgi:anti-anti-sigma regulatory factor
VLSAGDRIRSLADHDPDLRLVVLDLEGADFIDSQGAAALGETTYELAARDDVAIDL